ncbi:hypothetical protein QBC35DRAFT_533326 [Podospora australis]|uniref:Uncharacterized protein n=1 Tax=Podospora australis TaxID=1536484 RepID=A0AAN7AFC5_9PEZI|nr:hypothetical protein QBC35DRAFT_533326 [Podospora australis]
MVNLLLISMATTGFLAAVVSGAASSRISSSYASTSVIHIPILDFLVGQDSEEWYNQASVVAVDATATTYSLGWERTTYPDNAYMLTAGPSTVHFLLRQIPEDQHFTLEYACPLVPGERMARCDLFLLQHEDPVINKGNGRTETGGTWRYPVTTKAFTITAGLEKLLVTQRLGEENGVQTPVVMAVSTTDTVSEAAAAAASLTRETVTVPPPTMGSWSSAVGGKESTPAVTSRLEVGTEAPLVTSGAGSGGGHAAGVVVFGLGVLWNLL